jgi:HAD superfamily hydrolase (TIGR01490 family)
LKRISLWQLGDGMLMLLAYRLGIVDIESSMRRALAIYRGEREEALADWTREWYEAEVRQWVTSGARSALEEHRRVGHRRVLLTSSSPYMAGAVGEELGLDGWISSRYEVDNGLLTGEPVSPICYGSGKVSLAERWARQHGVDLSRSYFYTDSYTDLPMLLRVGRPRVVNPDLRLRLAARRRGWTVLTWR